MQPITTVPVGYLMAPIVAATVLNVFLFAGAWRADQLQRSGKDPWWFWVGAALYTLPLGLFVYYGSRYPASNLIEIFAITLASEAMGAVIVYSLLYAFVFTRQKPLKERAFAMILSLTLLGGMIGATLSRVPV